MKRATRILPTINQPLRTSHPLLRHPVLLPSRPLAGPSSLPLSFQTIRSATTCLPPSSTTAETSLEDGNSYAPEVVAALKKELEEAIEGLEKLGSAEGGGGWPGNVRFEGVEEVEEVPRGLRLHTFPAPGSGEPILLPISSLASSTPTLPAPSNLAIPLDPSIFALPLRRDILHRNVVWYLSTLRQGNQSTKSRSTVNYSGRKLRQQKGTGRARVGDASSGTRRGGAPIFPLRPRDHAQLLPRKIRFLGLRIALSSKLSSGLLRVVQDLSEAGWEGTNQARRALCDETVPVSPESEEAPVNGEVRKEKVEILRRFGTAEDLSVLFLHAPAFTEEEVSRLETFTRVVRNLPGVEVLGTDEVTVWHVLKYRWIVMEGAAVDAVSEEGEWVGEEEFGAEGFIGDETSAEAGVAA